MQPILSKIAIMTMLRTESKWFPFILVFRLFLSLTLIQCYWFFLENQDIEGRCYKPCLLRNSKTSTGPWSTPLRWCTHQATWGISAIIGVGAVPKIRSASTSIDERPVVYGINSLDAHSCLGSFVPLSINLSTMSGWVEFDVSFSTRKTILGHLGLSREITGKLSREISGTGNQTWLSRSSLQTYVNLEFMKWVFSFAIDRKGSWWCASSEVLAANNCHHTPVSGVHERKMLHTCPWLHNLRPGQMAHYVVSHPGNMHPWIHCDKIRISEGDFQFYAHTTLRDSMAFMWYNSESPWCGVKPAHPIQQGSFGMWHVPDCISPRQSYLVGFSDFPPHPWTLIVIS